VAGRAAGLRYVRLLLDEMLSPQIARDLRERGHDVLAIKERAEWVSLCDDDVIELARTERRAIVTNNLRDYRPRAAAAALPGGVGHYGMVFLPSTYRRTKADIGRIVTALDERLASHPDERGLHNQETWLG
jgi:Domain of unknown function (DUF5615)